MVDLNERHGPVGLLRNPDIQDRIGEALAAQGIEASFGEPLHSDSYPTMKLNWYRTRRVVKWSRVVREEKAAEQYGITALPAQSVCVSLGV